ncbi:SGNH/GDSL hydrolase family protein [Amycolatopsis sp. CA-126428]|uniref:SGNH/GDSL hydrolase family protein n=1 Tax=Amycolatopsis sp. CA-126428 TaxID=2073158 RepID=UPI000CD09DEB|nr:SGNH/GDSL hydrolase family protein [Amycolatopsis sp. CA-126428]
MAMVVLPVSAALLLAPSAATAVTQQSRPNRGWVAAWATAQVAGSAVPGSTCPAGDGLTDQTVRNVLFVSTGGDHVRVRVTNSFGARSLRIGHVTVARQGDGAAAVPGTVRELTFGGRRSVILAPGARELSDPVPLNVAPLSTLLVTVHVPGPTGPVTNHPFTAQGNYLAAGDRASLASGAGFADTPCWMLVDGVDVTASRRVEGSVVAFGDSITDTANTTGNANHRWPDFLSRRLDAVRGPTLSVVNAGLGGNRLLADRPGQPYYGVAGVNRLDRDVFEQTGVRGMILLEGINDIGYNAVAPDIIAGYRQVVRSAHAHGVRIYGATLTPMGGSFMDTPEQRQTWLDVNAWIRTGGAFDGVLDFAAATASKVDSGTLNPAYDSGDHLHPNDAGTRAMADAVDLKMLLAPVRR